MASLMPSSSRSQFTKTWRRSRWCRNASAIGPKRLAAFSKRSTLELPPSDAQGETIHHASHGHRHAVLHQRPGASSQRNHPRRARWRASVARSARFQSGETFLRLPTSLIVNAYRRQSSHAWTWLSTRLQGASGNLRQRSASLDLSVASACSASVPVVSSTITIRP